MLRKWDGHTHSHFCKHGSDRHLREYVERAAELGFERYTVSEHPPLPAGWIDDRALMAGLAMDWAELAPYLACARELKREYGERMDVAIGLEMDYLYGSETFTEAVLAETAGDVEDVLVSVHYLPGRGGMRCVDYRPDDFRDNLLSYYGSMRQVTDAYFDHIELAIRSASAWPWSKRLGHIGLIWKFRTELPPLDEEHVRERMTRVLPLLESCGVGIDVNTAGLRKPTCGSVYVPEWFMRECARRDIPLVFGSDAHRPDEVGSGWDWFAAVMGGAATGGAAVGGAATDESAAGEAGGGKRRWE